MRGYEGSKRRITLSHILSPLIRVEAPRQTSSRRHFDQIKTVAKVNPKIIASLQELCRVSVDSVEVWMVWEEQGWDWS